MIYGSVCSGIEAASVAWHPLGWKASFVSEIDNFPRAVLAHHYPEVPLHGDFTTIQNGQYESIDLLVGGTPCQSFSIAGLRGGLDDDRGNLALEFLKLAQRLRPRWVVWENVPGVLSSNRGRDFGSILAGLGEVGYGFAYRVLDAQYFGLAQRRKRVFVVGYLGDWRRAAAVLFERESLSGNPAPSLETGQRVAKTVTASLGTGGADYDKKELIVGIDYENNGHGPIRNQLGAGVWCGFRMLSFDEYAADGTASTMKRRDYKDATDLVIMPSHIVRQDTATLSAADSGSNRTPVIAFTSKDYGGDATVDLSPTMRSMGHAESHANGGGQLAVSSASAVRRLTPTECERLQGFPDGYTNIPYRGKPAADGPRYKALGNSMAVPVMRWIGERIQIVDNLPC